MTPSDGLCQVIVPCKDEALALPGVLSAMPADLEPIVVDNGSRDATAQVARSHAATLVSEPTPGYGAAVQTGLAAVTSPYVAVLDGDGSMDPGDLPRLLAVVTAAEATMAVGRRRPVRRDVWPWHARLGTAALAWWVRRGSGVDVHDLAPMRVCRTDDLRALGVADRRFGYPLELMVRAGRAGWTVRELDICYRERAAGSRSKVSGSVRGTVRTVVDFTKVLS